MKRLVVTTTAGVGKTLRSSAARGAKISTQNVVERTSDVDRSNMEVGPKMPPFDHIPAPYDGPSAEEILRKRKEFLSPSMFYFYKNPLNIVEGKMQYLYDDTGRRYLDAFGGIATVCCGHCHPDVVSTFVDQTKKLQHSTILYLNNAITDFAEALASKLPGDLKVVFFTNSGTEANELALMIARLYTGSQEMISVRNGYHGNAAGTMAVTAQCNWKFNVVQSGVHHAMNPDPYRGIFGSDGEKYVKDVQEIIDYGTSGKVAGFISEAIQGVGGIVELAQGYLPSVYKTIRDAGGLCIADEVQSGFARPGTHFWGFQAHGVVPDIVTVAKGIGNGIPMGAVVTTPEIAQVLTRRSYFNTFGGSPACTAGGLAVLRVLEKDKLQENAHVVGSYLKQRLEELQHKHEIIGDVRGRGLMLGIELVTDRKSTPAKSEILHVMEQMREKRMALMVTTPAKNAGVDIQWSPIHGRFHYEKRVKKESTQCSTWTEMGVLIGKGGFFGNVFRITPPLCFTKQDSDFFIDAMDLAMSKL